MKYYRVYTGFTDYIPIDSTEIEKAMYAFITGNPVAFQDGATTRIDRIVPDYHRAMGWNPGHKLEADDWNELARDGVKQSYDRALGIVRDRVQLLMDTGRTNLIGQNVKLPELEGKANPKLSQLTTSLAEKMKAAHSSNGN